MDRDNTARGLQVLARRLLPTKLWGVVPEKELRLLRRPLAVFYGQKVLYALAGMTVTPVLAPED